ncbi:MAG: translation initiation factor Sui1 [Anaerohalosphaeraceae bacterium]
MKNNTISGLVYSTDQGRMCPLCGKSIDQCVCKQESKNIPAPDGIVRVGRETKGRKGKAVTLITGVPLSAAELKRLARELKARCGCGGTVKDGVIEIQGDHRDKLIEVLKSKGWSVKSSGGSMPCRLNPE